MPVTFNKHPYEITFMYPHDAVVGSAQASVTMKAPERGDKRIKGRNQTFARLKNGNVVVYDMGTSMSDMLNLSFEEVPQAEYAALIVFFEYVTWGANKIKYVDYKGDEYVVRIYKNTVDAANKGETKFGENASTLYDFTLDLIDVTNNVADTGQTAVPTQLALHLADYDHPHNPLGLVVATLATSPKVVESVLTSDVRAITWLVNVYFDATFSKTFLVNVTHNRNTAADTDATTIGTPTVEVLSLAGTDPAASVVVSATLTGVGAAQAVNLVVTTSITAYVRCRRIKL